MNTTTETKIPTGTLAGSPSNDSRKVWVGCLASYNAGNLHGEWFELDDFSDCDEWSEKIQAMLKAGPAPDAEEWHICDHEGFHGVEVARYESLETVFGWHELFEEHEHVPAAVVAHLIGEDRVEHIEDIYRGTYEDAGDYAAEMSEGMGDVPQYLENYIDWEKMERDMELGGDISILETGYKERHILDNHC